MPRGVDLRTIREEHGLSLNRMAQRTHFTKSYLSMLETGKRPVTSDVVSAYEQALGVSVAPADSDPLRIAHEWLVSASPMTVHTRSGGRVGDSLATALESRVIQLRHLDDTVSSDQLGPVITKELTEAERLLRSADFTETTGKRLFATFAELSQLAGWVASDAGQYKQAERFYLSGVEAAKEAKDDTEAFPSWSGCVGEQGFPGSVGGSCRVPAGGYE